MKIVSLCLVLYTLLISSVKASIYYVDPLNGGSNNNTGLLGSPWSTIQKAASSAKAGDTVYVAAGTYSEKVTFNHSGTENALISFIGVGSVQVEEPANTSVWSGTFNLNSKSYIRIQNFSIQNAYWFGIYVNACNHIYLENNSTYNTGSSGISVWNSSYVNASHNVVRKACYQSLTTGSQECITFSGVSNFEINNNEVYESGGSNNGGEGIDTKENCSFGKVYNNVVHDLIRLGIYVDSWDKTLHDVDIYNNRVYKCGDGIVISSENGGTVTDVNIFNNIIYSNNNFGIVISNFSDMDNDGPRKNITIMNNTIYNNGYGDANSDWGGGIIIYTTLVSNIYIYNNIVSSNDAMQISDKSGIASVSINKNLIYGYRGLNWTNEVKGTNVIESNPLFADVDGADNIIGNLDDDLNVNSGSLAINAGTNINAPTFDFNNHLRPSEGIADIGAYEANSVLGINNTKSLSFDEHLIQVYPNPGNGDFNVRILKRIDLIEIIDLSGFVMQSYKVNNEMQLNISISKHGIYVIRAYTEDTYQMYKLICN